MKTLVGFRTLVWREIYRFLTVIQQTVFPPVISSFLYIFIFGYSIGRRIHVAEGVSYLEFLIPGLMMMYVIEGSYTNTSSSLFISRWANNIEELLVTPLSYMEMVVAILIGALARVTFVTAGVYGVSLLFVQLPISHPWAALYIFIFSSLTFSSIGMMVALFAEDWEHLSIAATFVITPLIFLGGVFNSISMIPESIQWVVKFNPMFYMINGMRYGLLGTSDIPIWQCIMVTTALFAIFFFTMVHLFRIGFKLRT